MTRISGILIVAVLTIVFFYSGCGTKKAVTTLMPCEAEASDDELFMRALGHGTSTSLQFARKSSLNDAQSKIISRLCDSIRTFMPIVTYRGDSIWAGNSDTILFKYPMAYFGELSYTRKECEKVTFDSNKRYHCFIVLALLKEDIEHASKKVFVDYQSYQLGSTTLLLSDSVITSKESNNIKQVSK